MNIISTNELITLYHGSKSGIHGAIAPISRMRFNPTCNCLPGRKPNFY